MIDPDTAIMVKRLPEVIPKRELPAYAKCNERKASTYPISGTRLRLEKRIVNPGCRFMAIDVFWDDVKISAY